MIVLRWLYDLIHPKPTPAEHTTEVSKAEAKAAVVDAEDSLTLSRIRAERSAHVSRTLVSQADRNHFAELIEASMRSAT